MTRLLYDERMSIDGVESFSPSAAKPERFAKLILSTDRYAYLHESAPVTPVTIDDLKRVHDPDYVDRVFAGREPNGFGNTDPRVPTACLWTIGSLVGAVECAAEQANSYPVCSPSSGFHHAGYSDGGGFCTFNGLMVAAQLYLDKNPGHKVGIIDCDVHFGDGTADILRKLPDLAKHVVHHTSGKFFHEDAERLPFFHWLHEAIEDINDQGCNVVIYQAGGDMHKDDPLGGFLDDDDMAARDRMVFSRVKAGVAWNLAGGYRKPKGEHWPVLETHRRTWLEAWRAGRDRQRAAASASAPDLPAGDQ